MRSVATVRPAPAVAAAPPAAPSVRDLQGPSAPASSEARVEETTANAAPSASAPALAKKIYRPAPARREVAAPAPATEAAAPVVPPPRPAPAEPAEVDPLNRRR
jgi:hypothetical protein